MIPNATSADYTDEFHEPSNRNFYRADFHDLNQAPIESTSEDSTALVEELRSRACPAGLDYTGNNPEDDHGHTDCYLHHKAANYIEKFEFELSYIHDSFSTELTEAYAEISRLEKLISAWVETGEKVNVSIGGFGIDIDVYTKACDALRKAVGQ